MKEKKSIVGILIDILVGIFIGVIVANIFSKNNIVIQILYTLFFTTIGIGLYKLIVYSIKNK